MPPVGAEADAVRDRDTGEEDLRFAAFEAVKFARGLPLPLDHGAGPESAPSVHAAVIEAHVAAVMFRPHHPIEAAGFRMIKGKSGFKRRDDLVAAFDETERTESLGQVEGFQNARLRIVAEQAPLLDI